MARRRKLRRPPPGVYDDVPFDEYLSWPYLHNSALAPALISGRHYELAEQSDKGSTQDQDFGTLVHALVLDPEHVDELYAVEPEFTKQLLWKYDRPTSSSEFKAIRTNWQKEQRKAGREIVTSAQWEAGQHASESIRRAWPQFHRPSTERPTEISVVSIEPDTGQRIKIRIDSIFEGDIVDIKTTRDIPGFDREIVKWGYHRQGAIYQDVLAPHVGGELYPVTLVTVESSPPYGVRIARMPQYAIEAGRREYMRAVRRIVRGRKSGRWQDYSRRVEWTPDIRPESVRLIIKGKEVDV